jgi:hypothetical protein
MSLVGGVADGEDDLFTGLHERPRLFHVNRRSA